MLTQPAFTHLFQKLTLSYPPRTTTPAEAATQAAAYWDTLRGQAWLTDVVLAVAVRETLALNRPHLLSPGQLLDVCRFVHEDGERQQQREAEALLPPPPVLSEHQPPPGAGLDFWNRNVAIGKARQRIRDANIRAWREATGAKLGAVPAALVNDIEPNEAQIAAVLAEMGAAPRPAPRSGDDPRATVVEWTDGSASRITLNPPPRREALPVGSRAQQEREVAARKTPDWRECWCGVSVIEYGDGRILDAASSEVHACRQSSALRAADRKSGRTERKGR